MIHLCYTPKVNLIGQAMAALPKSVSELTKMIAKMPGFSERGAERFLEWWWQRQVEKKDFEANWSDFIKLKPCQRCFNFSYSDLCDFCQDDKRDKSRICVVISPFTTTTIEEEAGYNGQYFVLGGELVNGRSSKAGE
jgi:recombination protein RecR